MVQVLIDFTQATRDLFASLGGENNESTIAVDALEEYLEAPPMKTVSDPLKYWHLALESGSENAALAQMALDYLSMPGEYLVFAIYCSLTDHSVLIHLATSTDAERSFSRGRLTVSRLRHSLADEPVRANTVL